MERAELGGGSGAEGLFKSLLAGAFKASGLISCREDLERQDHLPMSLLARQLVLLCPSPWHHVMLRAGVWVDGAWPGSTPVSDLLPGPGSTWTYPGVQFTLMMRKRLGERSQLGPGELGRGQILPGKGVGGMQHLWVHQE